MAALAQRVPHPPPMDKQTAIQEVDMTEIEERIEEQKTRGQMLQKQLDCECPSTDCQVEHES
jgi:hypothetical protein